MNGCACSGCRYTNSFGEKGFAAWPRGAPAGKRGSEASYRAHVAMSFNGAKKKVDFGPVGAAFYGVPAGSSMAEVAAVLKRSFEVPAVEAANAPEYRVAA